MRYSPAPSPSSFAFRRRFYLVTNTRYAASLARHRPDWSQGLAALGLTARTRQEKAPARTGAKWVSYSLARAMSAWHQQVKRTVSKGLAALSSSVQP